MTNAQAFHPPLAQIAFSVIDLRRSEAWFREGLGFLPAGGGRFMMSNPMAERIQGLPGAESCAWWMVGRNRWFQFELFQFRRPVSQLMPADFRPCDTGFSRLGVHVQDFDAALANLAKLGSHPLATPVGEAGSRRACVRNPDGVYVEIMEDDPLPQPAGSERGGCPVAVRSVTLSTPDFDASVAYLTAFNGKGPDEIDLHNPEHEAIWGLPGASCKRALFRSGDILIEVVQYLDPVGKPWPAGYRISDQGILNIAYGTRTQDQHKAVCARVQTMGARPNCKPLYFDGGGVVYFNDPLGFSIELVCVPNAAKDLKYGFEPLPLEKRPLADNRLVTAQVRINAPLEEVWAALNDHPAYSQWTGFDTVRVSRAGAPDAAGVGLERQMSAMLGAVVEQVVGIEPLRQIRYRVIDGAPFKYHRGEINLSAAGEQTEVHWQIGFRGKLPLVGALLRWRMQGMFQNILDNGLKPYVEGARGRSQEN